MTEYINDVVTRIDDGDETTFELATVDNPDGVHALLASVAANGTYCPEPIDVMIIEPRTITGPDGSKHEKPGRMEVTFEDGTLVKVATSAHDTFDPEVGLKTAIVKRLMSEIDGNTHEAVPCKFMSRINKWLKAARYPVREAEQEKKDKAAKTEANKQKSVEEKEQAIRRKAGQMKDIIAAVKVALDELGYKPNQTTEAGA